MKNIKTLLFLKIILLFFITVRADGDKTKTEEADYNGLFQKEIRSHLFYPAEAAAIGKEGFVLISFTIKTDGKINIIDINSNDMVFINAIKQTLSEITLCTHAAGKIFNMKFDYKMY